VGAADAGDAPGGSGHACGDPEADHGGERPAERDERDRVQRVLRRLQQRGGERRRAGPADAQQHASKGVVGERDGDRGDGTRGQLRDRRETSLAGTAIAEQSGQAHHSGTGDQDAHHPAQ
jgi:hypothetical protein